MVSKLNVRQDVKCNFFNNFFPQNYSPRVTHNELVQPDLIHNKSLDKFSYCKLWGLSFPFRLKLFIRSEEHTRIMRWKNPKCEHLNYRYVRRIFNICLCPSISASAPRPIQKTHSSVFLKNATNRLTNCSIALEYTDFIQVSSLQCCSIHKMLLLNSKLDITTAWEWQCPSRSGRHCQ